MSDNGDGDEREEGPSIGVYEGERNELKERHGKGKNTFPNGDVYEGQYVSGKRQGLGSYIWKGTYSYSTGGKKKGIWVNGTLSGPGEIIHEDHKVSGHFLNNFEMKMPAQLSFPKVGYSKTIANPALAGLSAPVAVE
ncbi:hypothetical protein HDU91_000235 [Kappamyces sp. JEL0680]|nr:hypothetical protein HDU91_000235 [Kappamyces sp. JEL0680]